MWYLPDYPGTEFNINYKHFPLFLPSAERSHQGKLQIIMNTDDPDQPPFWKTTALADMSQNQWEQLCDGCARCCLNKLEDWDTGEIIWTNVACSLLDGDTCRCMDYSKRFDIIHDCLQLSPKLVRQLSWLPPTCAYRLLDEGKDLPTWHPLVTGDPSSVEKAGISVKGRTIPEDGIAPEELENHTVKWPGRVPQGKLG